MATLPKLRAFAGSDEPALSTNQSLPLFPSFPGHRDVEGQAPPPPEPAVDRIGIARLAATSPLADSKRGAEYFLLPARSILNRCDSDRVPFTWTVNPYRGCEFGCKYCYARYTHEYMELDGGEFERKIFVKQDAREIAFRAPSAANISPLARRPIPISRPNEISALHAPYSRRWPNSRDSASRLRQNRIRFFETWIF